MAQKAETLVPNLEIEMNLGLTVTSPDGDTWADHNSGLDIILS